MSNSPRHNPIPLIIAFALSACLCHTPAVSAAAPAPAGPAAASSGAAPRGDFSYENTTLNEDVTWRGTVVIRGGLTIAPQATLRIEPGTLVRFLPSPVLRKPPRLVVMGRVHVAGSQERPVVMTGGAEGQGWGGVLLLATEKRNQLDHLRIEGAETGLDARFSAFTSRGLTIGRSSCGVLLRDSSAGISGASIGACQTALESHDSELDLRDSSLADNRSGIAAYRSGLVLASVTVAGSSRGLLAEECRVKASGCEFSGNGIGAELKGGEGQLIATRVLRNREAGLQLAGVRLKIQRCLVADNSGDGVRVQDGRPLIWGSAFSGNGGYNLANAGREDVAAPQNWWGGTDEGAIAAKIMDRGRDPRLGQVIVSPWLPEKPALLP